MISDKVDIVGLPSGQIINITKNQLLALRDEDLVMKVKRFYGINDINAYCFDDRKIQLVKSIALAQILDELSE